MNFHSIFILDNTQRASTSGVKKVSSEHTIQTGVLLCEEKRKNVKNHFNLNVKEFSWKIDSFFTDFHFIHSSLLLSDSPLLLPFLLSSFTFKEKEILQYKFSSFHSSAATKRWIIFSHLIFSSFTFFNWKTVPLFNGSTAAFCRG